MQQGLSNLTDVVEDAIGQYLDKNGIKARIVSKNILRHTSRHRSGDSRSVYKFRLKSNSTEFNIIAKQNDNFSAVNKEFRIISLLSQNLQNEAAVVPEPLFFSNGILLTEEFNGAILLQLLKKLKTSITKHFDRSAADIKHMFYNIGCWLSLFHANTALKELLTQKPEDRSLDVCAINFLDEHLNKFSGQFIGSGLRIKLENVLRKIIAKSRLSSNVGPVHGDFCYQNILLSLKEKCSCIIDFEDSFIGHQVFDLVRFCSKLRLLSARIINKSLRRLLLELEKSFLEGYSTNKSFDKPTFDILMLIDLLRIKTPLEAHPDDKFKKRFHTYLNRLRYVHILKKELKKLQG